MTPWVPIQDAADVVMRSVKTLRGWVTHKEVRSISHAETGETLVHWLDVLRLNDTKARRNRRQA